MSDDPVPARPQSLAGPPTGARPDTPGWDALPQGTQTRRPSKFCHACGWLIDAGAEVCVRCGARQADASLGPGKDRAVAVTLAFFLGTFGIHKFYLGRLKLGLLYLVFCWTSFPALLGWIEAIYYLTRSDEAWARKYPGPVRTPGSRAKGWLRVLLVSPLLIGAAMFGVGFLGSIVAAIESARVGPTFGSGRIERLPYGFAITFPNTWTVRNVTPEGALILLGEEGLHEGQTLDLVADRLGDTGRCLVMVDVPSQRDKPLLLAPLAAATEMNRREDETVREVVSERVDLAAGPAWRIDSWSDEDSAAVYLIRGPGALYGLQCNAAEPPDDRWRFVADSFELLPDPSTGTQPSSPVLGNGRIERPEEGFAVAFPDDWTVEELTSMPQTSSFGESIAGQDGPETPVLFGATDDFDEQCIVVDFTQLAKEPPWWSSIEDSTAAFLEAYKAAPGLVGTLSGFVELPAGRAGHISTNTVAEGTLGTWYLTDGEAWFYIGCSSPEPPDDGWRSIAETFEFLPREPG